MAHIVVIEIADGADVEASIATVTNALPGEHEVWAVGGGGADLILAAARGKSSRDMGAVAPGIAPINPEVTEVLRYFTSAHLPEPLREISWLNRLLAEAMVRGLPDGHAQLKAGLNWLLLAKDAFVRAALDRPYHRTGKE